MITQKQLSHLQKLAQISLNEEQEKQFVDQLGSVISALEELQSLDVSWIPRGVDTSLSVRGWVEDFEDSDSLLANITHPLINNSPIIKSVLDN